MYNVEVCSVKFLYFVNQDGCAFLLMDVVFLSKTALTAHKIFWHVFCPAEPLKWTLNALWKINLQFLLFFYSCCFLQRQNATCIATPADFHYSIHSIANSAHHSCACRFVQEQDPATRAAATADILAFS
ncbi:hypothetical protein CBL_07751 [Carabus blaptoides fortunei]